MVEEGGEKELGLKLEEEEAGGVVLESRTHCVDQEKHLEVGRQRMRCCLLESWRWSGVPRSGQPLCIAVLGTQLI